MRTAHQTGRASVSLMVGHIVNQLSMRESSVSSGNRSKGTAGKPMGNRTHWQLLMIFEGTGGDDYETLYITSQHAFVSSRSR